MLGSDPEAFGYEVGLDRALATLRRVFRGPFNFVDTSNNYGRGESERRIGTVLGELGGLPEGFVLASKVDPDPVTGRRSPRGALAITTRGFPAPVAAFSWIEEVLSVEP